MQINISKKTKNPVYRGFVDHVSKSNAFIIVEGRKDDIYVASEDLKGAWHGDDVSVEVTNHSKNNNPVGVVKNIFKRKNEIILGLVAKNNNTYVVIPELKRFYPAITLTSPVSDKEVGQKCFVKIQSWSSKDQSSKGEITKLIGLAGTHKAETTSIIFKFGLEVDFPELVENESRACSDNYSKEEIAKRRDFRDVTTITIDPDDAQDFDDALSIQEKDKEYEVGIHIADVTHYIGENSDLDKEAFKRSTSVYLVGKTVPMIPKKLSNDLCSLVPNKDRLAFSVVVRLNKESEVKDVWIGETIIHSNKRFTYDGAKESLKDPKSHYYKQLTQLNQLAKTLRKNRIQNGAIAFESVDSHIHLDEAGEPVNITPKLTSSSHHLIEEFMLLANKTVAEWVQKKRGLIGSKKKVPKFIYRIHGRPESEKVNQISMFIQQIGYKFSSKKKTFAKTFNQLLSDIKGSHYEHIVPSLLIRTMAQACYTTKEAPHFGLNFKHYTHFTSPIRRYSDIIVHRFIKRYLKNQKATKKNYEEIAKYISSKERSAIKAERTSIELKRFLFMHKLKGRNLRGVICTVLPFGLFIRILSNGCEGNIKISDLDDDFYAYDEKKFCLRGSSFRKEYKLGDLINVRIKDFEESRNRVLFELN